MAQAVRTPTPPAGPKLAEGGSAVPHISTMVPRGLTSPPVSVQPCPGETKPLVGFPSRPTATPIASTSALAGGTVVKGGAVHAALWLATHFALFVSMMGFS